MVIGYEWRGSDDSTQHWILERTDTNGRVVRSVTTIGATWGTLRRFPFETMVLVNPNDEADFQLASGVRSGFGALALVAGGVIFFGLGWAILMH